MIDLVLSAVVLMLLFVGAMLAWVRVADCQENRAFNREQCRRAELRAYRRRLGYRS